MIRVKLELQSLTDDEIIDRLRRVGGKLEGNATFPALPVAFDALTDDADNIEELIGQRDGLLQQAQQITLQIASARAKGEADLNAEASYVEQIINKIVPPATSIDPLVAAAKAQSAGMDVQDTPATVGEMPKITGLFATLGDEDGEIDLAWNKVPRGLKSYLVEKTTDPAGASGWAFSSVETRSKCSLPGLVQGTRYWFRVAAVGSAGQGPWSEAATKVAR